MIVLSDTSVFDIMVLPFKAEDRQGRYLWLVAPWE
jgi:hypothetical protein